MRRTFHIQLACLFIFLCSSISAQEVQQDTLVRSAPVFYDVLGNKVDFRANMPPLNQIAGAPKAYYTYYWEFGDGNYSFEEKPSHNYEKPGDYTVKLWSTNNYDNGKPPESRPEKLSVNFDPDDQTDMAGLDEESPFVGEDDLLVRTNREALPEQEVVLITSYKNTKDYVTNGKLYLFYNDTQFKDNNFVLEDTRMHHGEQISSEILFADNKELNDTRSYWASKGNELIFKKTAAIQDTTKRTVLPATLEESEGLYRDYQVIEFQDMQPGEERNLFRTLRTTPEMLKDTSAIVTLRSIYVPDENYGNHTVKDTELEIVTSHDPNKMSSSGTIMNYRFVRLKKVKFKVRFQNDGEGPANTIRLEVDTPEMFDKSTLEIMDMYPECRICPKREVNYSCLDTILEKDKIIFTFKKIYLPGTAQKGVKEKDSTKGFVKYRMKFGKNFHKKKTRSRTAIYFDKNEPILTNYSTTRFLPGISIGAKAGYIFNPDLDNSREYFAGATISPFKSYRGYLQAELFFSAKSFDDLRNFETINTNDIGISEIVRFTEANEENGITTYLVPISYRYNLNNFLAVGAGVQLKLDLSTTCVSERTGEFFLDIPGEGEIRDETRDTFQRIECDESFTNFQSGVFIGANVGGVRIGPSIGARYVFNFNEPTSQIQVYGIWKF